VSQVENFQVQGCCHSTLCMPAFRPFPSAASDPS
jgi:hypothetical protein